MLKLLRKILIIFQAILQVWVPAYLYSCLRPTPAYADRFLDTARQGQAIGRGMVPNAPALGGLDQSGNLQLNWQGQTSTLNPQGLFPDAQNLTDPNVQAGYGSNAVIMDQTNSQTQELGSSNSSTGKAYQTLVGSINRARVDMSNDPIWQQTDAAIERALTGVDTNCEVISLSEKTVTQAHVPDYETCERIYFPGTSCKCYHDYSVELIRPVEVVAGMYTDDDGHITVDAKTNAISACWGHHTAYGCTALTSPANYEEVCTPGDGEGVIRTLIASGDDSYNAKVIQEPSCQNGLMAEFQVHNTAGSHNVEWRTAGVVMNSYRVIDHGWTCDPGCEVFLNNVGGDSIVRPDRVCTTQEVCEDVVVGYTETWPPTPIYETQCHNEEICTNPFTCTQGPCETSTMIGGALVDQSMLYAPNPFAAAGISNLAHEVTIALKDFNQGQMDCWTDPQGEVHCPENPGDRKDTCEELENNPNCSFVRQECIEGAQDPQSQVCYAWTVIFDCGSEVGLDEVRTTMGYECDGIIRCLGEECVNGQFDPNNTGFGKAAAMLQVVQYAASDMNCDGGDCKIWSGEQYTCKKALGGWVDCCQKPENVSIADYIKLLANAHTMVSVNWDLTSVIPGPLGTNPLSGVWTDFTNVMSNTFSSAWDSLVGNPGMIEQMAGQQAVGAQVGGAGLTQTLMRGAYNLIDSISPDLAGAIFEESVFGLSFTPAISMVVSAMSFVMWLYTIYKILDILVHIIWACEQREFELGAKKQLRVCHYAGSYCNSDILGICIEKRESYCCYNSPLARIMQEQIRMQIEGWGESKHPRCDGLRISQLEGVNWSQVNLDEWLALLAIGGKYPTQRDVSLDGLTGVGSQLNFGNTGTPRANTAQRTTSKIEESGKDLEQVRIEQGLNLWGQGGGE